MSDPTDIANTYTSTWDGRGLLNLLNILFQNSINTESPKSAQPSNIRVPLRPHQLAVISAMNKLETDSINGREYNNYKTYSNFGFIGDEVGTGKSLMILSHIANNRNSTNNIESTKLINNSCNYLFTIKKTSTSLSDPTLLVVPHTIFRQWQVYIKEHTDLKVFAVKTKANLSETDDNKFLEAVKNSDFVLVSNTLYGDTMELAEKKNLKWKRIFFDEADTIHIPSTSKRPNAGFVWFVTASWANFILHGSVLRAQMLTLLSGANAIPNLDPEMCQWFKNEIGTISSTHDSYYGSYVHLRMKSYSFFKEFISSNIFRGLQVLRCRGSFIDESMTMPPLNNVQVLCEQPPQQRAIHGLVGQEVQKMLHAGDVGGALEHLGVKAEEPTTLLDAFMAQQQKELDRLKKTLLFKESMDYASASAKEMALATLKSKISSVQQQMQTFKERIDSLKNELCPICYEELTNTTMTPCCHRAFCGTCMLTCLAKQPTCPMCRAEITTNKLIHVSDKKVVKKKNNNKLILPRKPDALLDFILSNPTAKVLVFSRYENPFATLSSRCEEAGVGVFVLKGNKDCIANTIKQFEEGTKRVLFLPTETAVAGMNLIAATHVILYHAMTPEEERQAIGRAYRLGRKEPLSVVRLVHDTEA